MRTSDSPNPEVEFITKTELASRLKVSARTIEIWVKSGKIPCAKVGHTVRFDWAAVVRVAAVTLPVSAASAVKVAVASPANHHVKLLAKNLRLRRS
jgi:excisionase family DNA binding protein